MLEIAFQIAFKIVREPGVRAGSLSITNGMLSGGVREAFGKGPEPILYMMAPCDVGTL